MCIMLKIKNIQIMSHRFIFPVKVSVLSCLNSMKVEKDYPRSSFDRLQFDAMTVCMHR